MSINASAQDRRGVTAVAIGNVLEWYDFAIYIYLAGYVARRFFPAQDEFTSMLSTIGAFGVGYFARPIGAIVLGRLGDREGRKPTLILSMFLIAGASVLIGVLPTYSAIGPGAPVLLVAARLVQGFALGGAWGVATSLFVEQAPAGQRGLYGGLFQFTIGAGLTLASGVVALFTNFLTPVEMSDWGWRFPFLLGGILAPIAAFLARTIKESPAWEKVRKTPAPPTPSGFRLALRVFGLTLAWTASFYVLLNYLPLLAQRQLKLAPSDALVVNAAMLGLLACLSPLMGAVSDRLGRKPMLLAGFAAIAVMPYPLFSVLTTSGLSLTGLILCQLAFLLVMAVVSGTMPAALAELFPTRIRATWMTSGYAFAVALFGGVIPYWLVFSLSRGDTVGAYSIYLAAGAVVSFAVAWTLEETAFKELG